MNQLCRICKLEKDLNDFHKDSSKVNGHRNICKKCYKLYTSREDVRNRRLEYHKKYDLIFKEKRKEYRDRTKEKAKERSRKHSLKKKYNLTEEQYTEMCIKQNNRCLICSEEANLVVDHSHLTSEIRGLLCTKCNTGLGMFRDNTLFLESAINYLKQK